MDRMWENWLCFRRSEVCVQRVLWSSDTQPTMLLPPRKNQTALHHPLRETPPPLICLYRRDKNTLPVLTRKLSVHMFHMSVILKSNGTALRHYFFISQSHELSVNVISSVFSFKISGNRRWHRQRVRTYSVTAGEEMLGDKRQETKTNKKCSYSDLSCRGLIPSWYNTNFQCHWTCVCVC